MSGVTTFWIVLYLFSTLLFFGTAAVITVIGIRDLRDLLRNSNQKSEARSKK